MGIQWGPAILAQKSPKWVTPRQIIDVQWGGPDNHWFSDDDRDGVEARHVCWLDTYAIRLPADHSAYKAIAAGFEPWVGGAGAPDDWNTDAPVLMHNGDARYGDRWDWKHPPSGEFGDLKLSIIGYHKKENTMTDTAPEAPNTDAMPTPDAIARELSIAQAQRNALGQVAAHWIGRFFALKAAGGDIPPANVVPSTEAALREVDAMMQQLAAPGE